MADKNTVDEILKEGRLMKDLEEGGGLKLAASASCAATVLTAYKILHGEQKLDELSLAEATDLVRRLSRGLLALNDDYCGLVLKVSEQERAIADLKDLVNDANRYRFGSSSQKSRNLSSDPVPDRVNEKEGYDGGDKEKKDGQGQPPQDAEKEGQGQPPQDVEKEGQGQPPQDVEKDGQGQPPQDAEKGGSGPETTPAPTPPNADEEPQKTKKEKKDPSKKTTKSENLAPRGKRGKYDLMAADEVRIHISEHPDLEGYTFKEFKTQSEYDLEVRTVEHRYYIAVYEDAYGNLKEVYMPSPLDDGVMPGEKVVPGTHCRAGMLAILELDENDLCLPNNRETKKMDISKFYCSPNTLSNWKDKGADMVSPLYDALGRRAIAGDPILHIDETYASTRIKFEGDGTKMGKYYKKYVWVIVNKAKGICFFLYDNDEEDSRGLRPIQKFLGQSDAEIQSDAYIVYKLLFGDSKKHKHYICWAHARGKHFDAATLSKDPDAIWFVSMIGYLYGVELECLIAHMDADAIKERRNRADVTGVMNSMKERAEKILKDVKEGRDHRSKKMITALNYMLNNWEELQNYRKNGNADIDNSLAERSIRPFTVLRKNITHFSSEKGLENCCKMLSIIRTAENHNLNLRDYLTAYFEEYIRTGGNMDFEKWCPDNIELEELRQKRPKKKELTPFYEKNRQ